MIGTDRGPGMARHNQDVQESKHKRIIANKTCIVNVSSLFTLAGDEHSV